MVASLGSIEILPLDEAFALTAEFEADEFPQKVSLGAGVYRDEESRPWVLPSVKKAKDKLAQISDLNHEYLPIQGSASFLQLASNLILGDLESSRSNVVSFQTISGTGANHLGALFLARQLRPKHVFISDPTWNNHHLVWKVAAPNVIQKTYPYWNPAQRSLDFDGWIATLESEAVENDVVVLHACAHNPTGVDPTQSQWETLAQLFQRKRLFAFFDSAYQGFASGDPDRDAWPVRHFQRLLFAPRESSGDAVAKDDGPAGLCIAQSFAKNFGLYGERVGAFHLSLPLCVSPAGARSQLLQLTRAEISSAPLFGARIVQTILSDAGLRKLWEQDLRKMSSRIINVRHLLRKELEQNPENRDWAHLESQIGMFSYTGLTEEQVLHLKEKHHVYLMHSGRASLSGVNERNVKYVAKAISEVISTKAM